MSKNLVNSGGNFSPWATAQPPVEGPPPKLAHLLALHVVMNAPKIVWFGSPSAEQKLFRVWSQVGQILTNFHKSTPTSWGYCEPSSGRILVPFASKFLETVQFSGNLGENPFFWPPRRSVLNPSAKWLLTSGASIRVYDLYELNYWLMPAWSK